MTNTRPPVALVKRKRGGQTVYDPARHDKMAEVSAAAGSIEAIIAADCGIAPNTFASWYHAGDDSQSPYASFTAAVNKGKARWENGLIRTIEEAGSKSWQAAAWLLERRYPGRYARTDRLEHSGPNGERLKVTVVYEDVPPMPYVASTSPQASLSAPVDVIDGIVRELVGRDEYGAPVTVRPPGERDASS